MPPARLREREVLHLSSPKADAGERNAVDFCSAAGKIPDFYRSIFTGIFTDFYREGYFYRAGKNTDGVNDGIKTVI